MRTMRLCAICLLFLLVTSFLIAQVTPYSPDKNWEQVCDTVKAQPLSAPSLSGPLSAAELPLCDETALYYGFANKPRYDAALQCGWYQRAHPQETLANMFHGPGVLTMLYANGFGTTRRYDLAIRFACEQTWASEAEQGLRVGHLEHLRDTGAQTTNFDLCNDITSGLNQGTCAQGDARSADALRARKLAAATRVLPPGAKKLLPALQEAEAAFENIRIQNEIDLSGTARSAFQFSDETKLRDQFLINIERFGRGDIPPASPSDLAKLDRELNSVYRRIQDAPARAWEFGTVRPEGIRATQRSWLKLAESWDSFARIAYPRLSAERIRVQIIRLRLRQLRALVPSE